MPSRCATYRVIERFDGRYAVEVTSSTGLSVLREGFATLADAEAALRDLRAVLAAHAFHLVHAGGPAFA